MKYVKIINNGATYTSIARVDSIDNEKLFGVSSTTPGMPSNGDVCRVIKECRHPDIYKTLYTILDSNSDAFVIGSDGVEEVAEQEWETRSVITAGNPMVASLSTSEYPRGYKPNYNIGDTVICTKKSSAHFNKKYSITKFNTYGYDVVVGDVGSSVDRFGFKLGDIELVESVKKIDPDDKPQFSRNEILEVLKQEKSADEIILDLMDHITN